MALEDKDQVLVIVSDPQVGYLLERVIGSLEYPVTVCKDADTAKEALKTITPTLMICGHKNGGSVDGEFPAMLARELPTVPLILLLDEASPDAYKKAMRLGACDVLSRPLRSEDVRQSVQASLNRNRQLRDEVLMEARRFTTTLQRRVDELETLERLGHSITSTLDLESVLASIVDAAVELTGAEEGSLMLLDESTGELYMRAARNFQDDFVSTFRLPIQDNLIGSVLSTGQPVRLDEQTPQKIKTSYLVQSLVYVPLKYKGLVLGVLGVDNRLARKAFKDRDVMVLNAIGEYAVIALQNAALYAAQTQERNKLETILTRIQDGVIVLDLDGRLVLVNQAACQALSLSQEQSFEGMLFDEVVSDPDLQRLVKSAGKSLSNRAEVTASDGRVFSVHITPIPEVGLALTLHDITYLKKLDRIKSDFVSTVSHDLRSPLTAIMGYVELIERAGPVTERQKDFIRRVHMNVRSITSLMDDLLHLGHIESGFDVSKESLPFHQLIDLSLENFVKEVSEKNLSVDCRLSKDAPLVYANPVQMRQMLDKLIDNSIKYTPNGGKITITTETEDQQVILQVQDNGKGVPSIDLPYIFDKFYRGSNVAHEVQGTGLGLAIVKSIVENHQGRIWVDSTAGNGATFTVVLPLAEA